ncbi:hypothetical protein ES705_43994 [subsurface metagenome]
MEIVEFKFALGQRVIEKITGFEGVIMARTEYASGCIQYGILTNQLNKDGKIPDWEWLDESRLALVDSWAGKQIEDLKKDIGGPQQNAPEM